MKYSLNFLLVVCLLQAFLLPLAGCGGSSDASQPLSPGRVGYAKSEGSLQALVLNAGPSQLVTESIAVEPGAKSLIFHASGTDPRLDQSELVVTSPSGAHFKVGQGRSASSGFRPLRVDDSTGFEQNTALAPWKLDQGCGEDCTTPEWSQVLLSPEPGVWKISSSSRVGSVVRVIATSVQGALGETSDHLALSKAESMASVAADSRGFGTPGWLWWTIYWVCNALNAGGGWAIVRFAALLAASGIGWIGIVIGIAPLLSMYYRAGRYCPYMADEVCAWLRSRG